MNKRIKELAEQAGMYYRSYPLDFAYSSFDEEKFAKLIVQECVDILSTYRVRFEDGFEYNCDHPVVAINKHFGIE